jgi:hypothetical protein
VPLPRSVKIGNFYFDISEHQIDSIDLSPAGEVEFTTDDWSGGMLTVEDGLTHKNGSNKYVSVRGADAAFPQQIVLQPQAVTVAVASGQPTLSAPIKQVDFTGGGTTNTYLIQTGTSVHALNGSQQWTAVASMNGNNATDAVVHGGAISVAFSAGHKYATTGSGAWTSVPSTATDRLGVLGQNIWRAVRPNTLYSASAINGTWSSAYTVADSQFNINSVGNLEQVIMVGKEDGVYTIDAEGVVTELTKELRPQANTSFASVKGWVAFNGDYYFRTLNGILMISGQDGSKRRVGLDQLVSPDIPTPVVAALCADDRYLYALCSNSSNDLMILRRNIYGAWHVFYWDSTSGTKQGQHLAISGALGYPALFFSYYDGSSAYTTKYIRLATFPNPRQDTNYRYDTTSQDKWLRLGRFSSPEAPAVFDRCIIQSQGLSSTITVTPYYSVDGGAVTQFGSSAATSSPLSTIHPGTPPSGHLWDFYLYLGNTTDNTTTPVVIRVSFKGRLRPSRRRMHTFTIVAKSAQEDRSGARSRVSPITVFNNLNTLRDTNTYVSCQDENAQQFSGLIESVQAVTTEVGRTDAEPGKTLKVVIAESAGTPAAQTYTYGAFVYS